MPDLAARIKHLRTRTVFRRKKKSIWWREIHTRRQVEGFQKFSKFEKSWSGVTVGSLRIPSSCFAQLSHSVRVCFATCVGKSARISKSLFFEDRFSQRMDVQVCVRLPTTTTSKTIVFAIILRFLRRFLVGGRNHSPGMQESCGNQQNAGIWSALLTGLIVLECTATCEKSVWEFKNGFKWCSHWWCAWCVCGMCGMWCVCLRWQINRP